MRSPLDALVYKILVIVGASLIPPFFAGSAMTWQEYWFRSPSPNFMGAVLSVDVGLLIGFVGVLGFVIGLVGLDPESRKKYLAVGIVTIFLVYFLMFLLFSIPQFIPLVGKQ